MKRTDRDMAYCWPVVHRDWSRNIEIFVLVDHTSVEDCRRICIRYHAARYQNEREPRVRGAGVFHVLIHG